jgi:hypothetical protein
MSNAILSSNANSSLINTLLSSESTRNPNVYSTKQITPPYASTYSKCIPQTMSVSSGSPQSYNLMKYGFIQQVLFTYEKEYTAAGVVNEDQVIFSANDCCRVIDEIELLAAGRLVSMIRGDSLFAMFSDLSESESIPVRASATGQRATATALASGGKFTARYCVPIVFPQFESIDTQLNAQFLENLSINIKYGTITNTEQGAGTATIVPESMYMRVRYKSFDESQMSQILSANYDAPQLAQLSSRWYDEAPQTHTATAADKQEVTVKLANTDCVEDFFVVAYTAAKNTPYAPVVIDSVRLEASGQVLTELNAEELLYSRLSDNGWASCQDLASSGTGRHVAKLQVGLDTSHILSNCLSMRELNSPQMVVTLTGLTNGTIYAVRVVERTAAIFSTTSSSGRYAMALSN